MPRLLDPASIKERLEVDRPWAAYALADLEPKYFRFANWYANPAGDAICLLYRAFATPVLVCVGSPDEIDSLLIEIEDDLVDAPEVYAVVRPEIMPSIRFRYRVVEERFMWRMLLERRRFPALSLDGISRLAPRDLRAIEALYSEHSPDFFLGDMLGDGVYYGIYEADRLIAVAGTHVAAPSVGVAAVGNVYTLRARRGLGHSTRVTNAVTRELVERGFPTIVLNVRQDNHPAIRVYEKLGYAQYCSYYEVVAKRR